MRQFSSPKKIKNYNPQSLSNSREIASIVVSSPSQTLRREMICVLHKHWDRLWISIALFWFFLHFGPHEKASHAYRRWMFLHNRLSRCSPQQYVLSFAHSDPERLFATAFFSLQHPPPPPLCRHAPCLSLTHTPKLNMKFSQTEDLWHKANHAMY